jgi:hypothetical protein
VCVFYTSQIDQQKMLIFLLLYTYIFIDSVIDLEFPPSPTPMNQVEPTKQVTQSPTAASQENKECAKKKTGNYQANEDYGLCVSWIRITDNPIVGTNQDGGTFWKRVAIMYKKEVPESDRTAGSLKSCWGVLQRMINKFRACVNQIEQFNQSGASTEDKLNGALRLFAEDQKCPFKHLTCYNCLIKEPKWCSYIDENSKKLQEVTKKKRARSPSSEAPLLSTAVSEVASDMESADNLDRPIGRKKAKMIDTLNTKNKDWKEKIALAHSNLANKTTRQNNIFELEAELLRMIANNGAADSQVKIMNQDLSNLNIDSKEFFKLKKKEILANLCKQASLSTQ